MTMGILSIAYSTNVKSTLHFNIVFLFLLFVFACYLNLTINYFQKPKAILISSECAFLIS